MGFFEWVEQLEQAWHQMVLGLVILIFVAWLANWVVKRILVKWAYRILGLTLNQTNQFDLSFINRVSHVVPALVISIGISRVPELHPTLALVILNATNAFIVLTLALFLTGLLTFINQLYLQKPEAKNRPIKGYIEVSKIFIYFVAIVLVVAAVFDKSPLILLSGLGALAAVLLLIFQDTLLSLVASVQISANDIIRLGDWVEIPQLNADGDVIDIALHTVKIQNWDKTITTVPTKRFITDSFKNWRGMRESGGRRIKRSIMLDQSTIKFLRPDEIKKLKEFKILREYLDGKEKELELWNEAMDQSDDAFYLRRLTNLGTFRAYISLYLKYHPRIHQDMLQIVRQLDPTAVGLPLEVYCFTKTVVWVEYEAIQSDIFDHFFAIAPKFGLRLFQSPSGADLAKIASS